ncbi:MAG: GNAT family N-acetyltransferase [Clostridia bacterium]|nr:GNAT family N-acetyltransferase [Clostridia bacterium]
MIKPVTDNDIDSCVQLIRKAFADIAEKFSITPENCPSNPAFITADKLFDISKNGGEMFVYVYDGTPVGFMAILPKGKGIFEFEKLCVLPEFRHCGIGSKLIEHGRKVAVSYAGKKIEIGIIDENTVLKNWYRKNGFVFKKTKLFKQLPFTVGLMEMYL